MDTDQISISEILFCLWAFQWSHQKEYRWVEGVHGGSGFGRGNLEGERILEFSVALNLVVPNSLFTKWDSHLLTYQSAENQNQIDYILVKQQNIKLVCDVKVIPNEEYLTQHKLLVSDARIVKSKDQCKKFVLKRRIWKLEQADLRNKFCEIFMGEMNDTAGEQLHNIWLRLKQGFTLC